MIPTTQQILSFYDALPDDDKTSNGLKPRTAGRGVFAEWFLDQVVKAGHTPVRIRGFYLLEKALNARNRQVAKLTAEEAHAL